jgi:hypothetical protein
MGKNKSVSLPATPTYQTDPAYKSGLDQLMGLGTKLTNGDFTGDLSWLADTTTVNPDIIKGFFTGLQPSFQKMRQDTINTLAANNQLESSTTANALTQLDQNMADTMTGQVANLQTQALQNRMNLFGTGLNTISGATGMAQNEQNSINDFNLRNYENMVAKAMAEKKQSSGGLMGALTGGLGGGALGAGLGALLALPTGGLSLGAGALFGGLAGGGIGSLMGGLGPSGTGGSLMNSGIGMLGNMGSGSLTGTFNNPYKGIPGSSVTNSIGSNTDLASKYPYLFGAGLN